MSGDKAPSLAIVAKLDAESARKVKALWRRLAERGHEDTPLRLGAEPHVSLAILDESAEARETCRGIIEELAADHGEIEITFTALAMFPARDEDYYFLAPAASAPLAALHAQAQAALGAAGLEAAPQTRPGLWTPHCSLSEGVRENRAGSVVALLQDDWKPLAARLDRLSLVRFPPVEELVTAAL